MYTVFRHTPASVGFAQLSSTALAMNGAGGAVPSPTIGAVAAAVSGSDSPSGEGNGARRVRGDVRASAVGAVVGAVSVVMGAMMFGLVW